MKTADKISEAIDANEDLLTYQRRLIRSTIVFYVTDYSIMGLGALLWTG